MKRHLFITTAALGALAAGVVSLKGQGGTGAVMREARVTQVVKDVKLLHPQAEPRPATTNDTVRGSTAVRTGLDSRAELTFGDLTIARLGANTIFSFNEGSRTVDLANGAILLRVPKGSSGTKIQTAAVTAAITGTTVIAEYHPNSYAKYLVLEGTMRIYLKGILGESILLHEGQMIILNPNARALPEPVDFDLERLLRTSLFIQGFPPLASETLMAKGQETQLEKKAIGELIDTNLVIYGRGTLVTLTDPQSLDVIDRKTAAVTLPTPTIPPPTPTATPTIAPQPTPTPTLPPPTPTPTVPPPTPTATPTIPPQPTPTPTPVATPTPTPTVPPPTPTPTPTPQPTPSKFGTPPPIVSFVPYPIDNATTIQTDPAITRAGVTDFGKIYRDAAQDGPFSAWALTATTPFDTTVGIDALYGPNAPVAAFKFVRLLLVGDPIISTANGGATNLALIGIGGITSAPAGNATFTFAGMQSVLLATENGSIDISGPDIQFRGIPTLTFYARGPGSSFTLGGMGIFNVSNLRLFAENNIQINAPESLTNGANGGNLRAIAGGNLSANSVIETPTAFGPAGTVSGNGGTISLSALGGSLTVAGRIQASFNDPPAGGGVERHSATGGVIGLDSGLTTGTGISLAPGSSLLSHLGTTSPGPAGSITLTTAGSDIVLNNATLQADRGVITIQQTAAPPAGTARITIDGGVVTAETLLASSRGDLTIGSAATVNLSATTLSLLASRNITLTGVNSTATASASSGNVVINAGGILNLTSAATFTRSNGGITDGLRITLNGTQALQTAQLTLLTNGSGLTNGGDITVSSGGPITATGAISASTGPTTGNQTNGSNINVNSGGTITAPNMGAIVRLGANRTLSNGGSVTVTAGGFTVPAGNGQLDLEVINSAPGIIGTGGNVSLTLGGNLNVGAGGTVTLAVNNSGGGRIQTGGNINGAIAGNVNTGLMSAIIDNRIGGFINAGASLTFNINGTLTTATDANFEILNAQMGTPGGAINSATAINLTLGGANIGRDLNVFVDNADGKIGPGGNDWTVTLQINGTLAVTGRINVFGNLTSTGAVTAGQLSATNINAPSIAVGNGGITRFSYPNEVTVNPLHTITTNALTSTGGINFNGPDFGTPAGFGPFDGGRLTINVPSLTIGPSAANNIQGAVTFNGGGTTNNLPAGSGGTFTVNTNGALTVSSPINATTGLRPFAAEPSGTGGNVNLNSTNGTVAVNSPITVSSADPDLPGQPPRRRSAAGGSINVQSNAPTGVAINISSTGQLLSLLDGAAPGPGGKITILATGTSSRINVNGATPGVAAVDTIRADRGSVDIRHTGDSGTVALTNANIAADIVKVGALGTNGTLTIGGGRISADTILKLYAVGANGTVNFVSDVTLTGKSLKIIAGNTVTVQNNVVVQIGGGQRADVYVSDLNHANYSRFNGGNDSTSGVFIIEGSQNSPVNGANTIFGPPPDFGPPGGL